MPQDDNINKTETASESPVEETVQNSSNDQYIAESKKYRKRAQEAEARLAKLEKSLTKAEEDKLKEKEEFKTLYEQASSKLESLTSNAEKWTKYEETKRASLLESHPEEERESLSKLDLETLEYVTGKVSNIKPNPPEVLGNPRKEFKENNKDWTLMDEKERRENWDSIVKSASSKKN